MPKIIDEDIPHGRNSLILSKVKPETEPRAKKIENIRSMMSRFKDYTENMGFISKCYLGISNSGGVSLENFCSSVEDFIKDTLNSEPYKTSVCELNQYLVGKISYQINSEEIIKSYNLIRVIDIIPLVDEYIDKIYRGKKIQQGDRFEKSAIIIHILYSMLMADYVRIIHKNIKENNTDYLWKHAYEIGFLQGGMCLIESHLDTDMIDIHHKSRSSKAKDADWMKKHAERDKANQELDKLLLKPLQKAKDLWEKSHKPIYHNKMADKIREENKTLGIDKQILIEKLKPIARGYRYSTFCRGEFKRPLDIITLCQSISTDNYKIKIHSTKNTIDWLNEIIMTPDFYSKWFKKKGDIDLSPELDELIRDTHSCRKKKFTELTEEEQIKIKRLNRLLLEHTCPRTPKSLKHGLMKGWEGRSMKERY
jgi:hypothetical protein